MARRSRLAVIVHADVVGSTLLVQRDEHEAHERITGAFHGFSKVIARYDGVVHEIRGDAIVAEFSRASDAVCAALAFQLGNPDAEPADILPAVRVGISLGEVIIADGTVTGAGVVLAQRVEQLCEPGGVLVTEAIREALPARLPLDGTNLGKQELKGFEKSVRVYAMRLRPGASIPPPPPRRLKRGTVGALGAAAIVGVVAAAIAVGWFGRATIPGAASDSPAALVARDRPSIAVLPFTNLGGDPSEDYFVDGLTDDLITDLSKISGLFVIARHSVFAFEDQPIRVDQVARELGVRYVIEGSVRRSGDRIRVNVQVVEGATSRHLWAERYDRRITDLFRVQDDLVGRIVAALAVRLTQPEEARLAHRPAPKLDAYELYLKAREGYFSRDQTRMRESLDLYARATALDPGFARAHAGLAQLAADMWRLSSVRGMAGGVARKLAEDSALEALELDPSLAEAHSVLALLRLTESDHEGAQLYARRAVGLDPNSADAHTVLGIVLGYGGEPEAALDAIRTAVRLDPRPPPFLTAYHGWALFLNRRYADAIAILEPIADTRDRALADAPREILAMAYAQAGRLEEARAQVASLLEQEIFLNVAWYRSTYDYHARQADLDHRLEALRKAGMPEWPLGYEGDPRHRVRPPTLQHLVFGATWSGTDAGRKTAFIQEFGPAGDVAYAGPGTLLTGKAFIRDDELCERYEGFNRGTDFCGAVYRDAGGGGERYVYVNPVTLRYFSLAAK